MLYGVERQRPAGDPSPRSFSASPAIVASFATVAGIVGYLTSRLGVRPAIAGVVAIAAGVVVAFSTSRAIAKWWTVVPEHDVDDERYVLQGSLARVVADIAERGIGQITLVAEAGKAMPARGVDDRAMRAGTEVVIERIENGVAFVEEWEQVEKRL